MNRRTLQIVTTLVLMLVGTTGAKAYNGDYFDAKVNGVEFHFRVISESEGTVAYSCNKKGQPNIPQGPDLTLASSVKYNGKTYSITAVAPAAFGRNEILKNLVIPGNIKSIGDNAFAENHLLNTLELQQGVETLGDFAFGNTDVKEVNIPQSMHTIGLAPFYSSSLEKFTCTAGGTFVVRDGALCRGNLLIEYPSRNFRKDAIFCIPDQITHIASYAIPLGTYYYGVNLIIPEHVTRIDYGALYNWSEVLDPEATVTVKWDGNTIQGVTIGGGFTGIKKIVCPIGTIDMYKGMSVFKDVEEFEEYDEEFNAWFCGQTVKRSECENITRNVTSGRVSYDRFDKVFKLEDATIDAAGKRVFRFGKEAGLIFLYGNVTINSNDIIYSEYPVTIDGSEYYRQTRTRPKLTINSNAGSLFKVSDEMQWSMFEFDITTHDNSIFSGYGKNGRTGSVFMDDCPGVLNNNCQANIFLNLKDCCWSGTTVVDPIEGAEFVESVETVCHQGTTKPITGRIEFAMSNTVQGGLFIGGKALVGGNVPYLESGSVNWDAGNQTLTLNNATINVPDGEGMRIATGVQLKVYGTNSITSKGNALIISDGDSQFSGTGSLKVSSQEGFGLVCDYFIDFASGSYDIYGKQGAIDGTSRRGFDGDFEVNCPLRLSSNGENPVLKNVRITDNSSAYQTDYSSDPNDCYFIAKPTDAYYDEEARTLRHSYFCTDVVTEEIVYKTGRELNYQRYPLTIGKTPVSFLNFHQVMKGVRYIPDKNELVITGKIDVSYGDAICVEKEMSSNLTILVDGYAHVATLASDKSALRVKADVKVTFMPNNETDNTNLDLTAYGSKPAVWLTDGRVEFYCMHASLLGNTAFFDATGSSSLTLCHSNVKFQSYSNYTPVYVGSLSTTKETLVTPGVKFSSDKKGFVSTSTGQDYVGNIVFEMLHPTVWIAGNQVTRRYPYLGEDNTGTVYYDFHYDEMDFRNVDIYSEDGPAVRFVVDDEDNMNSDTYMNFYGENTLIGTTAGIEIEAGYDNVNEEYCIVYMGLYGGNGNASDDLKVVVNGDGPAIYLKSDCGSDVTCNDLNIYARGNGAFHADIPTAEDPYGMYLYINNCNVTAYNSFETVPTMGYWDVLKLGGCYYTETDYHLDNGWHCVVDGSGSPVYGEVLIRNRDDYDSAVKSIELSPSDKGFANGKWYSLDGRQLQGKPTKKGVYVVNGKKIVMK